MTWNETFDATHFGPTCYGFGSNIDLNLTQSEDCLNLNIVRPSECFEQALPVLIWIYGGGFTQGSNADPMMNLSYIVQTSVENQQPIIAVGINYRLSFLGFPGGSVSFEAGIANLGLKDQQIVDSTEHTSVWRRSQEGDDLRRECWWDQSVSACISFLEECLRSAPIEGIYPFERNVSYSGPVIDGDLIQREPLLELNDGNVYRVPIVLGANSVEGLFVVNLLGSPSDEAAIRELSSVHGLYPNAVALPDVVSWPKYNDEQVNCVFNVSADDHLDVHLEPETYRERGIGIWMTHAFEAFYGESEPPT